MGELVLEQLNSVKMLNFGIEDMFDTSPKEKAAFKSDVTCCTLFGQLVRLFFPE